MMKGSGEKCGDRPSMPTSLSGKEIEREKNHCTASVLVVQTKALAENDQKEEKKSEERKLVQERRV